MKEPLISVLIPFFAAEDFLLRCLESVASQTYSNIEIIVVNDCSPTLKGKDSTYQIVKKFKKKYSKRKDFNIFYFEHKKNEGSFETRRSCVQNAKGEYCCFVDDDDALSPNNLFFLCEHALSTNADIVQCSAQLMDSSTSSNERLAFMKKFIALVHDGILKDNEIINNFLCKKEHSYLLWGKLFRTSIVKQTFEQLPHFYGVLADDYMLYYFICRNSHTYAGYKESLYFYNVDSGLTSEKPITELSHWERICSASSVFSVLYTDFEKNPPTEEQRLSVQKFCFECLIKSIVRMNKSVLPEIKEEAYKMFCDYWGESFVEKAEEEYKKTLAVDGFPLISILIPFYEGREKLVRCLESVASQTYSNIEVVIVNDSGGQSDKDLTFKLVEEFKQKYSSKTSLSVCYFEHEKNEGTFEARRTCFEQSHGEYCFFLDSDDSLPPKSLEILYRNAISSKAEIVQGTAQINFDETVPKEKIESSEKKVKKVFCGKIEGSENIIESFLCKKEHSSFLWGKLILSSIIKKAYSKIPYINATMAEDFLLYYFICSCSSSYFGFTDDVYIYDITSGLTSYKKIDDLERWEKVCSVSSVFTILYNSFSQNPPSEAIRKSVQQLCCSYLVNNLKQLELCVIPELYKNAYDILCENWGKSFVEKILHLEKQ